MQLQLMFTYSLVFILNHNMFNPNWPSSGVQVVVKNLLCLFPVVIASGYFYIGIKLKPN
jgi:hypothetical protein